MHVAGSVAIDLDGRTRAARTCHKFERDAEVLGGVELLGGGVDGGVCIACSLLRRRDAPELVETEYLAIGHVVNDERSRLGGVRKVHRVGRPENVVAAPDLGVDHSVAVRRVDTAVVVGRVEGVAQVPELLAEGHRRSRRSVRGAHERVGRLVCGCIGRTERSHDDRDGCRNDSQAEGGGEPGDARSAMESLRQICEHEYLLNSVVSCGCEVRRCVSLTATSQCDNDTYAKLCQLSIRRFTSLFKPSISMARVEGYQQASSACLK